MLKSLLEQPLVTEVCTLRSRFGLMAYHGGNLERTTDAVAREVAERTDASFYAVLQEAPMREHVSSLHFDPAHSEALGAFVEHVDVVIAVHGYGRRDLWHHLLLGGRNRPLAGHVASHLRAGLPEGYRVLDRLDAIPRKLRGQHPRNPVNQPRQRGVQIELPPSIRWNRAEKGWSDHGGVSRAPHVDRLIDALAYAVGSWPG
jgi:phage replication-related protein YjqB (UPF0714/DUF867 family)